MKRTTKLIEVEVFTDGERGSVVSPIGSDTLFFPINDQLQESTEKVQEKYSESTDGVQKKYRKSTSGYLKKYREKSIRNARKYLPQRPSPAVRVAEKWHIIEALQTDIYGTDNVRSFDELVMKIEAGEIQYCPRPLRHAVNRQLAKKVSLTQLTQTIKLYIEYRKAYSPTGFWLYLDNGLDSIDRMLDRIIRIEVFI